MSLAACALLVPWAAACTADGPTGAASVAPVSSAQDVDPRDDELRAVFSFVGADAPGCSAAIGEDGAVAWAVGFGLADVGAGIPITPATVFDIASTSKQFTATGALLLANDGLLDLDAPIRALVPELAAWADTVTARQMMHHTSGIPDYISLLVDDGLTYEDRATTGDALQALRAVDELEFDPGSEWSYSNSNYLLLGVVVERVTGAPLARVLDERVFTPLGLDMVVEPVAPVPGKATSYEQGAGRWVARSSMWEQVGDGAIQTTPSELVRWAKEYWDPAIGGEAVLAARTSGAADDGAGGRYGAGIVIDVEPDGTPLLTHAGAWLAFSAELLILPDERLAAAVTCNVTDLRGGPDPTALALRLLDVWRGSRPRP